MRLAIISRRRTFGNGLGADNGPGFGWRDVTAIKTGIAYAPVEKLTLRVGYNYSTQPIPDNQTYFNILAPAVVQHHVTGRSHLAVQQKLGSHRVLRPCL